MNFTHIVDTKLAKDYAEGRLDGISSGNLSYGTGSGIKDRRWHQLNKPECLKAFGPPSARNLDLEGAPDLHLFTTEHNGKPYTLVLFADSVKAGHGSSAELVGKGFRFSKDEAEVMLGFIGLLNKTMSERMPKLAAKYAAMDV